MFKLGQTHKRAAPSEPKINDPRLLMSGNIKPLDGETLDVVSLRNPNYPTETCCKSSTEGYNWPI
jgi:hypothetical protein